METETPNLEEQLAAESRQRGAAIREITDSIVSEAEERDKAITANQSGITMLMSVVEKFEEQIAEEKGTVRADIDQALSAEKVAREVSDKS